MLFEFFLIKNAFLDDAKTFEFKKRKIGFQLSRKRIEISISSKKNRNGIDERKKTRKKQ